MLRLGIRSALRSTLQDLPSRSTPPWRHIRSASAQRLRRAVRNASWVTIDVFDTALFRCVPDPEDVFEIVGMRCRGGTGMPRTASEFRACRREAEYRARQEVWRRSQADEVTLAQIYECLGTMLPGLDVEHTMQQELEVERAVCVANPDIKAFYDRLQRDGINVAFVSDTYLPSAFIDEMTKAAGYDGRHELFVSSEAVATKYRGTLFPYVAARLGASPARIVHIGDNVRTDFLNGREAGFQTYWYRRTAEPRGYFRAEKTLEARVLARIEALSIDAGEGAAECFEALGAGVLGPLFLGLTQWLARSVQEQGAELVLICARDGYVIHQIYERLRRSADLPPSSYFLASRRALTFPCLTKIDERALDTTLSFGDEGAPFSAFFERIGLDLAAFPRELAEVRCDPETRVTTESDRLKLRELFVRLEPHVLQAAAAERPPLLRYFQQIGFSETFKQLAFFDIGWGGSLLEATSAVVRELGARTECRAYYLATDERIRGLRKEAGSATSWLSHAGEPADVHGTVYGALWLLEIFFCAPHGSVLGYRLDESGTAVPVLREFDDAAPQVRAVSAIQDASLRFVDRWLAIFGPGGADISPEDAFRRLQRFVERPTNAEIDTFGGFTHVDHVGSTPVERPLAPALRPSEIVVDPKGALALYRRSFWKLGVLQRLLRSNAAARAMLTCAGVRGRAGYAGSRIRQKLSAAFSLWWPGVSDERGARG